MQEDYNSLSILVPSHVSFVLTKDGTYDTTVVQDGTVQCAFIEDEEPVRELCRSIEAVLLGYNDLELINGNNYSAPVVTRANVCRTGTFIEWGKAKAFAEKRAYH